MECLMGIAFKDFVLLAADRTCSAHGILVVKPDDDKTFQLADNLVMAVSGEPGDTVQFAEYIAKNIQLYKMRNGYELSPAEAAHYTRRTLAEYLRTRTPYQCNLLLAGHRADSGPELYFMDYLGSMAKLPYAAHGYGGLFSLSVMDRYYKADATEEEALDIMKKCVAEIQTRLIVNLPKFQVLMVNKDGVKRLDDVTVHSLKQQPVMG
ncbi:proteasome subunit beta type-2-like [Pollicipes pollicipes]|uniref:proteasome subunit beta type-2-like n=1 Tax=Pollicipes pollicipes TaxID=41117 RepID=UPI0018858F7E|nr:proteasome subunit beta type-2-like [Pollicipes pollicipes]